MYFQYNFISIYLFIYVYFLNIYIILINLNNSIKLLKQLKI